MSASLLRLCLPLTLVCACSTAHEEGVRAAQPVPGAASSSSTAEGAGQVSLAEGAARDGAVPGERADGGPGAGSPRQTAEELALWNDPSFRRRFVESYVAETEIEPRVTSVERDKIQQVLDLLAADERDEARASLEKQRGEASSAVFDFLLGNLDFQDEDFGPAAEAYLVAVDKYPKFRRAWKNLGLIRVREGDFAAAHEAFTRVLEQGGGDAVTYGLLGFASMSLEDNIAAESAYRMANLLEPSSLDWKMGLTRSLFKQTRYADAASLCDTLIAANPDRADLWLLQANAYIGLERLLDAAENFEFVDQLGKSTPESLNTLADIYVHSELPEMAVDAYVRALQLGHGKDVARPIRAAQVLASQGDTEDTARLLDAIDANAGDVLDLGERKDVLKLRSLLAVANGAGDEEARVLEEIVALDPLDGDALLLLGDHAKRAGESEQAAFYYERAAVLPDFEADAKVRHAQLLVGQGKYVEALPLLRRAQTLEPRSSVQDYLDQVERRAKNG